jgi:hypothetical protein
MPFKGILSLDLLSPPVPAFACVPYLFPLVGCSNKSSSLFKDRGFPPSSELKSSLDGPGAWRVFPKVLSKALETIRSSGRRVGRQALMMPTAHSTTHQTLEVPSDPRVVQFVSARVATISRFSALTWHVGRIKSEESHQSVNACKYYTVQKC